MRECSRIYNMLKYIFEALTKRKHPLTKKSVLNTSKTYTKSGAQHSNHFYFLAKLHLNQSSIFQDD